MAPSDPVSTPNSAGSGEGSVGQVKPFELVDMQPLTLVQLQQEFAQWSIHLMQEILFRGYEFTYGETWRDPRIAVLDAKEEKGIVHSLHTDRLAIDINLFKDGVYLPNTESHRPFGEYWKGLHPLARWGGDFGDGNHYSFEYQGRK